MYSVFLMCVQSTTNVQLLVALIENIILKTKIYINHVKVTNEKDKCLMF